MMGRLTLIRVGEERGDVGNRVINVRFCFGLRF